MALDLKSFFKSFQKPQITGVTRAVGVDFGSSSIKVVELEQKDSYVALKTYGELQLGPYVDQPLGKSVELSPEQQTQALVDVMRESGVTGQSGVLALPLNASFVTVIKISARPDEDLAPRIKVEARKYIPIPLSDVSMEWTELSPYEDQAKNVREVLVAAVQNDAYRATNELLLSVGLAAQPTEIEMFCAQRAITNETMNSTMIVDFGAQTCKAYIVKDGMVRKIHRVFSGGAEVTEILAKEVGCSFEDAENAKRHNGTDLISSEQIRLVTEQVFTRALQECKRVLTQFENEHQLSVGEIVFTGGSVASPHLHSFAVSVFDRKPITAHPFNKIAYPAFMEDTLNDISPTFSVALGASLRMFTA